MSQATHRRKKTKFEPLCTTIMTITTITTIAIRFGFGSFAKVNRKPLFYTVNEKTGLLGQRVVTSQIKEHYPPSPTRDLYRALSPAYSPIPHDLEWQDEFKLAVEYERHDSHFKKILMPQLKILQKRLTQEFRDIDRADAKLIFSGKKVKSTATRYYSCF